MALIDPPKMPLLFSPSDPDVPTEEWYRCVAYGFREAWDNPLAKAYLIGWPYPRYQLQRSAALALCNEESRLKEHTAESVEMILDLATLFWKEEREVSWMLDYLGRMTEKRGLGSRCHRVLFEAASLIHIDSIDDSSKASMNKTGMKIAIGMAMAWCKNLDRATLQKETIKQLLSFDNWQTSFLARLGTNVASCREYVSSNAISRATSRDWCEVIREISPELPALWTRPIPSL
jgi:hypothetical protein